MYKVAILDDEKNFLEEIHNCLQEYEMFEVSYFQEAKLLIDEIDYFDVVYIDYEMENMTAFVTQVASATFQGLNIDLQVQLSLLARSRSLVFEEDYNGNIKLMGLTNGAYGSAGTSVTGAAKGDLSGYTIELTAEEKEFAPFLSSAAKNEFYAAVEDVYVS